MLTIRRIFRESRGGMSNNSANIIATIQKVLRETPDIQEIQITIKDHQISDSDLALIQSMYQVKVTFIHL